MTGSDDKAGQARADRLAEALRENLKKRKAQARSRKRDAAERPQADDTAPDDD